MRSFTFKLNALMRLRESKKEQALMAFASAVRSVEENKTSLNDARSEYEQTLGILGSEKARDFTGASIQALQASLALASDKVAALEVKLSRSREIEKSRRNIFLRKKTEFESISRLKEKQELEHYFSQSLKEQRETEDVIGSRFLYQKMNPDA